MMFHNQCNILFSIRIKRNCFFLWKSSNIINFLCGPKGNRFVKCCTKDSPRIEPPLCVCTVSFFTSTTSSLIYFSWECTYNGHSAWDCIGYHDLYLYKQTYQYLPWTGTMLKHLPIFRRYRHHVERTPKTSGWPLVLTCIVFLLQTSQKFSRNLDI